MEGDSKEWWSCGDGHNSKAKGYEDFKADSDGFKEKEGEEYRGERGEWKRYDYGYYGNSEKEWGGYSDNEGEDSKWSDQNKDWGFSQEEWETSMGKCTDSYKWAEDEYKGQSSEEYKEDNKGTESKGESEDITLSSRKNNEDNVTLYITLYPLEQASKGYKVSITQNTHQKEKKEVTSGNMNGGDVVGFKEVKTVFNQFLQNNNNIKTGIRQQQNRKEEWATKENPYRHYIKPIKEDYEGISIIWIIVFFILVAIKYYKAIRRVVRCLRMMGLTK